MRNQYDQLFMKYGEIFQIDWKLLKAIALTESNLNRWAVAYEGRLRFSFGLMQILYPQTLRHINDIARTRFTLFSLFDPDLNVWAACILINDIRRRYHLTADIVASYNAGSVRIVSGQYANQEYVSKVLTTYGRIYDV